VGYDGDSRLKGDRTAVILRMHHCLTDGIAGVGILNALLDANPEAPRLPKKKIKFHVPPPRDPLTSLTAGFVDSYSDFVKRILSAMADLLSMTELAAANGGSAPSDEFANLFPEITAFTERLRFNVIYQGPQKFAYTEIPLAEVKAIRHKSGTSINDVILTLVTGTIRRYCELHGDPVKGKLLRIMVPVNLRGDGNASELGKPDFRGARDHSSEYPATEKAAGCGSPANGISQAHACRRVGQSGGRFNRDVPDFGPGDGRTHCQPVADYAFQPRLHECAGTAIPPVSSRPQDAALLSVRASRRRVGGQLRHPQLQRHSLLRFQRRCARGA
jgi:hypothetical protein